LQENPQLGGDVFRHLSPPGDSHKQLTWMHLRQHHRLPRFPSCLTAAFGSQEENIENHDFSREDLRQKSIFLNN
jgi:hypothetical protein